jgi:hypothetical protein
MSRYDAKRSVFVLTGSLVIVLASCSLAHSGATNNASSPDSVGVENPSNRSNEGDSSKNISPLLIGVGATFDFVHGVKINDTYLDVNLFKERFDNESRFGIDMGISSGQNIRYQDTVADRSNSNLNDITNLKESRFIDLHASLLYTPWFSEILKFPIVTLGFRRLDGTKTTTRISTDTTLHRETFVETEDFFGAGLMAVQYPFGKLFYKVKLVFLFGHLTSGELVRGIHGSFQMGSVDPAVRIGGEVRWWYPHKPVLYVFISKDVSIDQLWALFGTKGDS